MNQNGTHNRTNKWRFASLPLSPSTVVPIVVIVGLYLFQISRLHIATNQGALSVEHQLDSSPLHLSREILQHNISFIGNQLAPPPSLAKVNSTGLKIGNASHREVTTRSQFVVNKNVPSPLPKPIFLLSLPKSATTSVHGYFSCGGYRSANHWSDKPSKQAQTVGQCFQINIQKKRPLTFECGNFSVWTDIGFSKGKQNCFFPSISGLDAMYNDFPNATIVLLTRDSDAWYHSLDRYYAGILKLKISLCQATGISGPNATEDEWKNMYRWHHQLVRTFAATHPSMTYLEFALEDPLLTQKLYQATGIVPSCWKTSNFHRPKHEHIRVAAVVANKDQRQKWMQNILELSKLDQELLPTRDASSEQQLPTPILVASLPDHALSLSVHKYFSCGGYKSAFYWTDSTNHQHTPMRIGECFQKNFLIKNKPPLEGCGDYQVWSETGYADDNGKCFHPSVDGLARFHGAYPNGTIILMKHKPGYWSDHVEQQTLLKQKLERCDTSQFPNSGSTAEAWEAFSRFHEIHVRLYKRQYPSLTFLEFSVDDPHLATKLEQVIGIQSSCWLGPNLERPG